MVANVWRHASVMRLSDFLSVIGRMNTINSLVCMGKNIKSYVDQYNITNSAFTMYFYQHVFSRMNYHFFLIKGVVVD